MSTRRAMALLGLLAANAPGTAEAGVFFHRHEVLDHEERPHPTPEPGEPRHICHTLERAGRPDSLARHLEPTDAGDASGYYVGGGGGGRSAGPRCREEGTFGWDYTGFHLPRRVVLGWNHGRKVQAGTGSYKTDGPFEVPNVFATEPPKLPHGDER